MLEMIAALLGGGLFGRSEVDFWGARRPAAPPAADLWADSPAPPTVKRLLDAPTPENARAYVEWQRERLRRLQAAMAALEAVSGRADILYFSRDGCRWCALQDRELEGLPVTRVPEGSPLWREHAVEATPTLVVKGRALRGYAPRAAILRELGRD